MRSAQSATAVKVRSVIFKLIIVLVFYSSNKLVVDCEDGVLDFLLATLESEVFLHVTYLPVSIRLHVEFSIQPNVTLGEHEIVQASWYFIAVDIHRRSVFVVQLHPEWGVCIYLLHEG